ncbi:MAG: hypothetical protein L0K23_09640, partial [Lacticaseibacillus paracasei]|nr:hypothetical protein [Lacticaseibacillus paracasei]MDN6463378.1 hypothetical protein [Lacticaseibacillus paracasei]MDN6565030.1 hypothetical protein [Lacticaseibacillus paracasei]MDN6696955.1 hypothetical protein [Lacticaseibacillus paracasei]MDN6767818.1 hypothetical protein [Lacticaseibacillus paracasei]
MKKRQVVEHGYFWTKKRIDNIADPLLLVPTELTIKFYFRRVWLRLDHKVFASPETGLANAYHYSACATAWLKD